LTKSSAEQFSAFLEAVVGKFGSEWVDTSTVTTQRYGESALPGGPRLPSAVVYPGDVKDVQSLVRTATRYGVQLHPVSTGQNVGLGGAAASSAGMVLVDLGRRMNRILEFDARLRYVVVEPGVTYQALHDFLVSQGDELMCDTTSGPPLGSPLGNTLDKGGGYTTAADHFANSCGLEVVLGDGRILRTGDGSLAGSQTWHLSRYGLGPVLDGLFLQSNYGIVTRMGIWLAPRPKLIESFFFMFPDDDQIGPVADVSRHLRLDGHVPTAIKATSDLYLLAAHVPYPGNRAVGPIPDDLRRSLQVANGIGAWVVSGAVYGADPKAVNAKIKYVRNQFESIGAESYVPHADALARPELKVHIDTYSGRPTAAEVQMVNWRGGGILSLTPSTPMVGSIAASHARMSREILNRNGLDACIDYIFAGRASRGLHTILFNPDDPQERERAALADNELRAAYREAGYPVGRVPLDGQHDEMSHRDAVFRDIVSGLKELLDPHGVISPGRYGVTHRHPAAT
jgi:4-cresol dehydrogenase (hydroxylating) flavoprotein subunit